MSLLTRRPTATTAVASLIGLLGSALVARASYVAGTPPGHHIDRSDATGPYHWVFEIGVLLLVVAWFLLGRLVLDRTVHGMTRRVCWAGIAMAAPLLMAAPVTSQDVWAYLAQANVAAHGLDPYSVGPSTVPGPYTHAVASEWLDYASPYGPLWIWACRLVVEVTQPHVWAGMFALRGIAVVGLTVIAVVLTRLSRVTGARPEVALWVAVTGPFPLLMLLDALHNDSSMLALMLCGVAVAATAPTLRRALLLSGVLVGAAGAIKVIALIALPFLPLLWFRYAAPPRVHSTRRPPSPSRWVATGAVSMVVGVLTVLAIGVVSGLGLGWVPHVGDGRVGVNWLSVPQWIGSVLHLVAPGRVAGLPSDRYSLMHAVSLVFLVVTVAAVTLTARRRPPLRTLTILMLLLVVSSVAPRTWYLLWPLVLLAADQIPRRLLAAVVAASAALVMWYPPSVHPAVSPWVLLALFLPLMVVTTRLMDAAGFAGTTLDRRPEATAPQDPHPG